MIPSSPTTLDPESFHVARKVGGHKKTFSKKERKMSPMDEEEVVKDACALDGSP